MVKKKTNIVLKSLSKKLKGKKIGRKSNVTLVIKSNPIPSTFDQGSHFFANEVEEAEKALFFR